MDALLDWLHRTTTPPVTPWVAWIAAALVLAAGWGAKNLLFGALHRLTQQTPSTLDDILVRRMRYAAVAFVVLVASHVGLMLRGHPYPTVETVLEVCELLLVAYLVIETFETLVFDWYFDERRKLHIPEVVQGVVLALLYLGAILAILASRGFNVTPILATSTVVSVVIGLALQETLGNLFAGLALHAEQAFGVGDWILVDGVEGKVVNAGWRSTQLQTFTGDIVSIPNNVIGKSRNQNFNRPEKETGRNIEFLVRTDADPARVDEACRAALLLAPNCLANHPRNKVWFVEMHPLYARYVLRAWVNDFAVHDDMESDLRKALWTELKTRGLDLPNLAGTPLLPAPAVALAPSLETPKTG